MGERAVGRSGREGWRAGRRRPTTSLARQPQSESDSPKRGKPCPRRGRFHPHSLPPTPAPRTRPAARRCWRSAPRSAHRVIRERPKLVTAWGTGAAPARGDRFRDARGRRERPGSLVASEDAIKKADAGGSDDAVVEAAAQLPGSVRTPSTPPASARRAEALKLIADVQRHSGREFPSDRKVASASDRLKAKNQKLAKRLGQVEPDTLHAEAEAVRRREGARRVRPDRFRRTAGRQAGMRSGRALWAKHSALLGRRDREEPASGSRSPATADRWARWSPRRGPRHLHAAPAVFHVRRATRRATRRWSSG